MNSAGDVLKDEKLGSGEWVVVSTVMTGGGTAHGPHDVYPNGHQLTLRKLIEGTDKIDWKAKEKKFYQSGCFIESAMLREPVLTRSLVTTPCLQEPTEDLSV